MTTSKVVAVRVIGLCAQRHVGPEQGGTILTPDELKMRLSGLGTSGWASLFSLWLHARPHPTTTLIHLPQRSHIPYFHYNFLIFLLKLLWYGKLIQIPKFE